MKMTWAGVDAGWILETENPISQETFIKIWEYTVRDQRRQIANIPAGPERDVYQTAYGYLKDMKITQTIKPQGGVSQCQSMR